MQRPKHNQKLVAYAKQLRREMTPEERHLWYDFLRDHPARFQRQKILGHYIADFYSAAARLVIELDGGQHYEAPAQDYDARRTEFLHRYGLTILRLPNNELHTNFPGVCQYIDLTVRRQLEQLEQSK